MRFSNGEVQKDEFSIHVVRRPAALKVQKIAVFDPKGETKKLLTDANVAFDAVDANVDLSGYELFIIGKEALSVDGPGPNVDRVSLTGLKVIVFEQSAKVLEQRLQFRATEYGLREVFPRVPDHPALAGLDNCLHDWRGEATSVPARLDYVLKPQHGPTVKWCGIEVSRVWRCGNRGNVASVLIEKPARGSFLPIVDGGYALQYSPLLEFRDGTGLVLFCSRLRRERPHRGRSRCSSIGPQSHFIRGGLGALFAAGPIGRLRRRSCREEALRISRYFTT